METVLLLAYLAGAAGLIALLVYNLRHPSRKGWLALLGANTLCLAAAAALTAYFDALPGTGMMPGLTWFAHTMYSLGAVVVYGALLCAAAVAGLISKCRRK